MWVSTCLHLGYHCGVQPRSPCSDWWWLDDGWRIILTTDHIWAGLSCDRLPPHPDHQLHLADLGGHHGVVVDAVAGGHAVPDCAESDREELCSVQLVSIDWQDWALPASRSAGFVMCLHSSHWLEKLAPANGRPHQLTLVNRQSWLAGVWRTLL